MGDSGPHTHSPADQIHGADKQWAGNSICRSLSNPDNQSLNLDKNVHLAIYQEIIASDHCGEFPFQRAVNQTIQAFRKPCIGHRIPFG